MTFNFTCTACDAIWTDSKTRSNCGVCGRLRTCEEQREWEIERAFFVAKEDEPCESK